MNTSRAAQRDYRGDRPSGSGLAARPERIRPAVVARAPAIEQTETLNWIDLAIAQLGPREFRRRLWHFAPGVLVLAGTAIPYREPVPIFLLTGAVLIGIGLVAAAIYCHHSIRRPGEQNGGQSIFGYGISVLPLFVLFPGQVELALTVAGIIAFGDGCATVVGLMAGRTKLPWNCQKSWAGTAAFVLAAMPMAVLIYWCGAHPHPPFEIAALCVAPAVLASAVVETIPVRCNDNALVGASAAVAIIAMHGLVVGWS